MLCPVLMRLPANFALIMPRAEPLSDLNDRVLPFFDGQEVKLLRVLTDRGSEYCGNPERHEYKLYLAGEDIDHSRTKTKSPQTNGICERFHKTVLNEFYRVAFRKKVYRSIDELQTGLDAWITEYDETAHLRLRVANRTRSAKSVEQRPPRPKPYRVARDISCDSDATVS
jgi:transposase InsO family protein